LTKFRFPLFSASVIYRLWFGVEDEKKKSVRRMRGLRGVVKCEGVF